MCLCVDPFEVRLVCVGMCVRACMCVYVTCIFSEAEVGMVCVRVCSMRVRVYAFACIYVCERSASCDFARQRCA